MVRRCRQAPGRRRARASRQGPDRRRTRARSPVAAGQAATPGRARLVALGLAIIVIASLAAAVNIVLMPVAGAVTLGRGRRVKPVAVDTELDAI